MSTLPLAVAPGIEALTVDDEALVFDGEVIHLMSGSGAQIWRAVDGHRSSDQVVADLAHPHPSASEVEEDTRAFLDDLVSRGLVTPAEHRRADGYVVSRHVAWTTDGPLVVLLDLDSGERKSLNLTASRAWLLLAAGFSLEAMFTQLAEEFPDVPPSFAVDTEALVRELCHQGFLVPTA